MVHYHIFKNAGTTFSWTLARQFGGQFAALDGPRQGSVLDSNDLVTYLDAHPHIRAVSSHHLNYPIPYTKSLAVHDCCLVRHPLRRLESVYSFLRAQVSDDAVYRLARTEPIDTFLRVMIEKGPHLVSNLQTAQIAGRDVYRLPVTRVQLELAKSRIMQMSVPGLVELYDQSMVLGEYFLQPEFMAIKLDYVAQNITTNQAAAISGSLDGMREAWGAKLFREVVALNELDLELYQFVAEEIGRRSAMVPNFRGKLVEFRQRSADLHRLHYGVAPIAADPAGAAA